MTARDSTRPITLDRPRVVRMDLNAVSLAEEKTGKVLWPYDLEVWKTLRAADYKVILWACLLDEDPTLTVEQVGRMLRPGPSLFKIEHLILDLFMEEYSTSEHEEPPRPTESGGENGGPSLASTSGSPITSSGN